MTTKFLVLFAVTMTSLTCATAQPERPVIPAVMPSHAPTIDGDLSDPCWKEAPSVSDFRLPSDGTPGAEPTTAWLCYDKKNVYVAFLCKDSQPDKIVAQQKKRGGSISYDDWVGIDIACYCDKRPIVWFDVSAGGVQVESLQSGNAENISWKGDWHAGSKRTGDGYTVEMAIPFAILQYDPSATEMAVAFLRQHARTNHTWWSPNMGSNSTDEPKNFYLWKDLVLPKPSARPVFMGYLLFGTGEGSSRHLGLDMKHAITPTMTAALALNPDFRNVEQQVDSVDFTYTERWLPEGRPFFQEGDRYFPGSDIFYTRRIGELDLGGKVYGKYGNYNLGLLHASRFGDEDYTVLSVDREWPDRASVYLRGVLSNAPSLYNTAGSISGSYKLYDRNERETVLMGGWTSAGGRRVEFGLSSDGPPKTLEWSIGHEIIDPDFDPYLGYIPEKGLSYWGASVGLSDSLTKGGINHWNTGLSTSFVDHTDSSLFHNAVYYDAHIHWQNGQAVYLDLASVFRPPYHDKTARLEYRWASRDLYRRTFVQYAFGRQAGGSYRYYSLGRGWLINHRFSVQGTFESGGISEPSPEAYSSSQFVSTLTYDIDNERTLAGRLITRTGGTNFYLAFKQRVRAGLDVYVIFGDPNAKKTKSSLLVKLVRPL